MKINSTVKRSYFRYSLLALLMLMPGKAAVFGQGGPLRLEEVKAKIQTSRLEDVNQAIKERGVSFVLTDGVKSQLEQRVKTVWPNDDEGYRKLLDLIYEKEPAELVVAVAKFQNGNKDDAGELRSAIEARLKTLDAPSDLLRIEPISVEAAPINDEEAYRVGNEFGVHLIIWGDWRLKPNGQTEFHPRIRVVQESRKTPIKTGDTQEQTYRLDLATSNGLDIIESGAVKTSNLIAMLVALSYYKKADYKRASQVFQSVPDADSTVYFYLGNCGYYSENNEEAEKYFRKSLELDKTSVKALHNLGAVQYRTGRREEALQSFRKALSLDANSDKTLNNLGIILIEQDDIEGGLAYLAKATTINPRNENAWYNIGGAFLRAGVPYTSRAIVAFENYLELQPNDAETLFLCAELSLTTLSNTDEAQRPVHFKAGKKFLLTAIEKDPGNEKFLKLYLDAIPIEFTREERERYKGFISSLKKLEPPFTTEEKIQNAQRNKLIGRTILISLHLDELENAREAIGQLVIDSKLLNGCREELSYRLVFGKFVTWDSSLFAKQFYGTTYEYFVMLHFEGFLGGESKKWLNTYRELLKRRPSDLGCLIAKGLLLTQVLQFSSHGLLDYGFIKKGQDENDWRSDIGSEARNDSTKASSLIRDNRMKGLLEECERDLQDFWR